MERLKTVRNIEPNNAITFESANLPLNNGSYETVNVLHYHDKMYKIHSDHYIMDGTFRIIDAVRIDSIRRIVHVMEVQQDCFNDDWVVILSKYTMD